MKHAHFFRLLSLVLVMTLVFSAVPAAHAFTLDAKEQAPAGTSVPKAPELPGDAPLLYADDTDEISYVGETEPNNVYTQANEIPVNIFLVGETSASDQADFFKFTLEEDAFIQFVSASSAPNMLFGIFTMNGVLVDKCVYYGVEEDIYVDAITPQYPLDAGTYILQVAQTSVENGPAAYSGPLTYVIDLHVHDTEVVEEKAPTCQEDGYKIYACGCQEDLPKGNHVFEAGVPVPPTCTEHGYTPYTCSVEGCTAEEQRDFVDPLGHQLDEETLTYIAEEKVHSATCTRCEKSVTEPCNFVKNAESGKYQCSVCGGEPDTLVLRIFGDDRVRTSMAIADSLKEELNVAKFDTIIVASALNFPDALTGSYLATVKNAPILLTYDAVNADVVSYITLNMDYEGMVYILGGESAVSMDFENRLTELDITYKRLAGTDRFGTNLAILEEAGGVLNSDLVVCTAYGFADSLSASASGKPILLVGDKLTEEQHNFLEENASGFFVVIGGTGVVSEAIEEELNPYAAADIVRLAGADRYETSVLVAERFYEEPSSVVLAYALNYPDGLCGGPLAYRMGSPLILTDGNCSWANSYMAPRNLKSGFVLGGSTLIEDSIVRSLFGLKENEPIVNK